MKEKEINVAIAEACGWKFDGAVATRPDGMRMHSFINNPKAEFTPDYCKDLNAMHEAFEYLRKTDEHAFGCMTDMLETVVGRGPLWHATARQRAEAFLCTVGKWKE